MYEGGDQANSSKLSKSWARQPKTESQRNKREAKKLQKYDSNSIDEEEFQDCKLVLFIYFHEFWIEYHKFNDLPLQTSRTHKSEKNLIDRGSTNRERKY